MKKTKVQKVITCTVYKRKQDFEDKLESKFKQKNLRHAWNENVRRKREEEKNISLTDKAVFASGPDELDGIKLYLKWLC